MKVRTFAALAALCGVGCNERDVSTNGDPESARAGVEQELKSPLDSCFVYQMDPQVAPWILEPREDDECIAWSVRSEPADPAPTEVSIRSCTPGTSGYGPIGAPREGYLSTILVSPEVFIASRVAREEQSFFAGEVQLQRILADGVGPVVVLRFAKLTQRQLRSLLERIRKSELKRVANEDLGGGILERYRASCSELKTVTGGNWERFTSFGLPGVAQ